MNTEEKSPVDLGVEYSAIEQLGEMVRGKEGVGGRKCSKSPLKSGE